jgi:hypothetical protein
MVIMDPVSIVVAALAAGAVAGVKDTAATAVKDAYNALKGVFSRRYSGVSTSGVEFKPGSKTQQGALEESLTDAGAGTDSELLSAAQALLEAIKAHDPGAAATVGVDLSRIEAESINISRVRAGEGSTGVRASDVKAAGAINIHDIDAGGRQSENP